MYWVFCGAVGGGLPACMCVDSVGMGNRNLF